MPSYIFLNITEPQAIDQPKTVALQFQRPNGESLLNSTLTGGIDCASENFQFLFGPFEMEKMEKFFLKFSAISDNGTKFQRVSDTSIETEGKYVNFFASFTKSIRFGTKIFGVGPRFFVFFAFFAFFKFAENFFFS